MKKFPCIVHVVEAFGGGVFQSVAQLCHGLNGKARLVVIHGHRAETPKDFKKYFPSGTRFIALGMTRNISPLRDLKHALALRRLIGRFKNVAAVHAHSSKAGALARVGLLGTGTRVLYSPRGYGFMMQHAPWPKRVFYWLAEVLLGLLPGTTVACGYDEGRVARCVTLGSRVIPNAIEVDAFSPALQKRPPRKNKLVVVCAGRITPQKNFPMFCEVARHFIGQRVSFLWVGGGEARLPSLPRNVTVTGWLPYAQAQKQINRGQVYLHLTAWEGLSRVVLEAMAHGFPLVVSDVPGNRELASAGNGFLCQNAADAIAALKQLNDKPALVRQMGAASLAHLRRHYNWTNALESWTKAYGLATRA